MQRENDVYLDEVWKHYEGIIMLYRQFEDKNPVMLLDIQEQRVYAYPYNELKNTLSKRSKELLKTQYDDAITNDKFVVFVKDNENKELRAYTFSKE